MRQIRTILSMLFIYSTAIASAQVVFVEDFKDGSNTRGWPVGLEEGVCKRTINDTAYRIESLTDGKFPHSVVSLPVDTKRNFELSTSINYLSDENQGAGLVFGQKDSDNYQSFIITRNGYFRYGRKENGIWSDIKRWTASSAINSENPTSNVLKVIRQGTELVFKINDVKVFTTAFIPFSGKGIGFIVNNVQTASFDFFKVRYLETGENHLPLKELFAREDFDDNQNNWSVAFQSEAEVYIKDGKYFLDLKESSGVWQSNLNVPIDQNREFEVKVRILKTGGDKTLSYGILYGMLDLSNFHTFAVTGDGKYAIGTYENGNLSYSKNWEDSKAVNKFVTGTSYNELKIAKKGNYMYYYVNEVEVTHQIFKRFYGDGIGFLLSGNQKIAIDFLEISYLD